MAPAATRVSLAPSPKRAARSSVNRALLDPGGPVAVIGGTSGSDGLATPIRPDAHSLFGPRGACLAGATGPLWVSDTGHHRLLGWSRLPASDRAPADWVIGQPDFTSEGRNARCIPGPATLNVPTGIARCGDGLAVADAWNHRVLIWHRLPRGDNVPADLTLGQVDFRSVDANRGGRDPSPASLFWPYGVHWDGTRLWVADSGNRRVLMWRGIPHSNGAPADLLLGQRDFAGRDENGGTGPSAASMRWPHDVALWQGRLCVADAGNNRIMVWNDVPHACNAPCDWVVGQNDFDHVDHNQSLYAPGAGTLNMPYGITTAGTRLVVADTANSRLIGWQSGACRSGAEASQLAAQPDFQSKGDNRWQLPARDSLCWPYGVMHCAGFVAVSDSGNNRISIWRMAAESVQ